MRGLVTNVRVLLGAIAVFAASASAPVHATPWFEIDAGDLTTTAETTVGTRPLDVISGHLDFDLDTSLWDIDLFQIRVDDPATFSARTVLGDPSVFVSDPVLFLFGFGGLGIYMNDDISVSPPLLEAGLPAGHASGPTTRGLYYLGVAWGFSDPQSLLGSIFPVYEQSLPTDGVYGPTGTGGGGPLASWLPGGPINFDTGSDYRIVLTGVFAAVPEPGALLLLATAGFAALVRRRKAPSSTATGNAPLDSKATATC